MLRFRLTGAPVNALKVQLAWLAGLDLAELGIPSVKEYMAEYCRRLGRDPVEPDQWAFYMAFSFFRIASLSQGIASRALEGTAVSLHALEYGRRARTYAELGWQQVEKILE